MTPIAPFHPVSVFRKVVAAVKALVPKSLSFVEEPAFVIGVAGTVALEAQAALASANVTNWKAAVPILLGLVIRQFTSSAVKSS